MNGIDCDCTERICTFEDYIDALRWLWKNENSYRTLITDTCDWLEELIFQSVAKEFAVKLNRPIDYVEDIGYGKGYEAVESRWRQVIDATTYLWERGYHVVFTCHSKIAKFKSPEGESYDYYAPSINDKGSDIICQWCDEVLFAKYRTVTRKVDEGFGTKRNIAIGQTERILCTQESPSHVGKNRLGLPAEMSLDFAEFEPFIGNINGMVVSGSSKKKVQQDG